MRGEEGVGSIGKKMSNGQERDITPQMIYGIQAKVNQAL